MTAVAEALRPLLTCARALRLPPGPARPIPATVDAIVIVGATCAGKTTVADAVRASALVRDGRVQVPTRFVTRPRRENDSTVENTFVSHAEFERRARSRELRVHWRRRFEGGREERYGFAAVAARAVPVYSGNNALFEDAEGVHPRTAMAHALVIAVSAPDDVRARRLRSRSPDLVTDRPGEVAHRLADDGDAVLAHAHVILENHGALESVAPAEAIRLVEAALGWVAPRSRDRA